MRVFNSARAGWACFMAGCMSGANRNPIPISRIAWATRSGACDTWTPNCSRTSALPHCVENDRLPCLATRTPAPATTNAATVEILKVPPPSPPVPQVSSRGSEPRPTSMIADLSRIARAKPSNSSAVSPLSRRPTRNAEISGVLARPLKMTSMASRASADERCWRAEILCKNGRSIAGFAREFSTRGGRSR